MTKQIISTVSGNLGHITLNRPKALNALTQPMVDEITRLMLAWEKDMSIGAVLIDGAGERAFLDGSDDAVASVMTAFLAAPPKGEPIAASVKAFGAPTMPDILKALDADGGEWAVKQASNLRRKSPLALSVTQEALRRGGDLSFRDAMTQELDISLNFLKTQDFYEGIRAQLIDKDRNPKWSHDGVSAVTQSQIERLFTKTANPPQAFLD